MPRVSAGPAGIHEHNKPAAAFPRGAGAHAVLYVLGVVSELLAVGSPGHDVIVPLMRIYTLVFIAFGVGVRNSVHGNHALRTGGGLLTAYGLWNIAGGFFPLRPGDDSSIPPHIVATNVQPGLMIASICFVAAGFNGRMRWYSIISLVLSAVMAWWRSWPRRDRTSCWASAKESASGHSCCGWQSSQWRCGGAPG